MGTKTKEIGGGAGVGVSNDVGSFLQNILNGGGGGAGPTMGAPSNVGAGARGMNLGASAGMNDGQGGIASFYRDLLSGGGGKLGGALGDKLTRDTTAARQGLMSQFSNIGGGQGSGAAQAGALFDAENAPNTALKIGDMQMGAMKPLFELFNNFSMKGMSQRETIQEESPWMKGLQIAAPVIGSIAGGPIGGAIGKMFSGGLAKTVKEGIGKGAPGSYASGFTKPAFGRTNTSTGGGGGGGSNLDWLTGGAPRWGGVPRFGGNQ